MSHLERRRVVFAFLRKFALQLLRRVFLIIRELSDSFIMTSSWWMRRSEWSVVFNCWLFFGLWNLVGKGNIFTVDNLVIVERTTGFHSLGEGFVLQFTFVFLALLSSKMLGSVKVIFHVRNDTTEGCLLSDLAYFRGVGQEVSRLNLNITAFRISVVFVERDIVRLVFIGGFNGIWDSFGRNEVLVVTGCEEAILHRCAHDKLSSFDKSTYKTKG